MIIEKIKLHNYVYGFFFSVVEFLLIILVIGLFMIYYFLHGKILYAIITLGIVLNCFVFVLFAAGSLIDKENDLGIIKFFNKKARDETYRMYPTLQRDTYVLSLLTLLPFMLILSCTIKTITKMLLYKNISK